MSHFRATGSVLYWGQLVPATHLPWHYAFVWIGITVPILYLLLWASGLAGILWQVWQRRAHVYASAVEWQDLLFLGLGLVPLATVVLLHSVLYNGWRQLYFVYPLLLLVALRGLLTLWNWQPPSHTARHYWQPALFVVLAGSLIVIVGRMVRLHPLENLYFNALAPTPVDRYYETDYWGLGLRNGLEWVAQHDSRPKIRVYAADTWQLTLCYTILPPKMRSRLVPVSSAKVADYLLEDSPHWHTSAATVPAGVLWADNVHLLDIYQVH